MAGGTYVMIAAIALLAVTSIVYIAFTPVIVGMTPVVTGFINDTSYNSTVQIHSLATIDDMANVWKYWPLMIVFGLLLWIGAAASRKEQIDY